MQNNIRYIWKNLPFSGFVAPEKKKKFGERKREGFFITIIYDHFIYDYSSKNNCILKKIKLISFII